jgi:hypothetical protein
MNNIKKIALDQLGYGFIKDLPKGKDEYYLRNKQNRSGITYRRLTALEIEKMKDEIRTLENNINLLEEVE